MNGKNPLGLKYTCDGCGEYFIECIPDGSTYRQIKMYICNKCNHQMLHETVYGE